MSSKLKQMLTLLLSVCVVFAFSSVAAFADGEEPAESEDVNVYYDKNGSETILGMFRVMADSSSVTLNKDGSLKVMITNKPLSRIYNKIALVAGDKTDEEKNAAAIDGIVKEVGEGSYQTTFSFDIDPSQVEKPIYVSFLSTSKGETSWGTNATYRIKVHNTRAVAALVNQAFEESDDVNVYYDKAGEETILGMFRVLKLKSSVKLNSKGGINVKITNKPLSRVYNKIAFVTGDKTDEEKNAAAVDGIVKEVGEGFYQTTFSFDIEPSQIDQPIYVSFLSTSKGETSWGTNATYRIKVHGNGSSKLKAQLDAAQKAAKAKADKEKADKAAKAKANRIKTEQNKIKNIALAKVKVKAGKKKLTVSWKKNTKFAGYQIKVVEQKTKKPVKTLKVGVKTQKKVIKGLKKKTKYIVTIRGYKTVEKTDIFGKATTKTVKVK